MSEFRRLAAAISRVGARVNLLKDGEIYPFTASIQPVLRHMDEANSLIGSGGEQRWSLYAPPGITAGRLEEGDCIEVAGARYRVICARLIRLRGAPAYWWASLLEETGGGSDAG